MENYGDWMQAVKLQSIMYLSVFCYMSESTQQKSKVGEMWGLDN